MQLHGFSDASEEAYMGVVYLRMVDSISGIHTSLIFSKTKVSPIKTAIYTQIGTLWCSGANETTLSCQEIVKLPIDCVYAWTDSTIVFSWLSGNQGS